jgi:transcriptional regulator with XRE-family HTH domain
MLTDIPRHLRALRQQRGLTLKAAAERSAVSLSYISDIECGRTQPSLAVLDRLAGAYGYRVRIEFEEAGD